MSVNGRPASVKERLVSAPFLKYFAKFYYPIMTRVGRDELLFMNLGYEEDPPMAVPLDASDEPNRFPIQLYHRTATQVTLEGKRVLEVSCGHGGGASYLVRTLGPASYTGLDLNATGLESCRERHDLPVLDFVQGNAESLPFPDDSFDAVINIEASHLYPRFPAFLTEVARVLQPGGHLLYADARIGADAIAKWDAELAEAPMRLMSTTDIREEVARAMEMTVPALVKVLSRFTPGDDGAKASAKICNELRSGKYDYRMYCFVND